MLKETIAEIVRETYEWDMHCWPKHEHRYNVEVLLGDSWYGEQIYFGPYESIPAEFYNIRPNNMYTTCGGGKRTTMHFGIPRNWTAKPCAFDRFFEKADDYPVIDEFGEFTSESDYLDYIDELEAQFDAA